MKVTQSNGNLVIEIPIVKSPQLSSTGKTRIVASSHGNQVTSVIVDGEPVRVGVNAFIPNGH